KQIKKRKKQKLTERNNPQTPLKRTNNRAPTRPNIIYTNMEKASTLHPKTNPANTAKKACNVIGTPPTTRKGTIEVILAPMAVSYINIAPKPNLNILLCTCIIHLLKLNFNQYKIWLIYEIDYTRLSFFVNIYLKKDRFDCKIKRLHK